MCQPDVPDTITEMIQLCMDRKEDGGFDEYAFLIDCMKHFARDEYETLTKRHIERGFKTSFEGIVYGWYNRQRNKHKITCTVTKK